MLPAEPLSVTAVVEAGISFYRATFGQTLRLVLIAALPYVLASWWFNRIADSIILELDVTGGVPLDTLIASIREQAINALLAVAHIIPLLLLGWIFILAAVGHRLVAIAREAPLNLQDDLVTGLKLTVPLSLVLVLYVALTSLGSMLFVVPGLIISVSMGLFFWMPLLDQRSAWSSLWRSHTLVWGGNWWRTASVISLVSIIAMLISLAFSILGLVLAAMQPGSELSQLGAFPRSLLSGLMMALVVPLSTCIMLVLVKDLQCRSTGRNEKAVHCAAEQ